MSHHTHAAVVCPNCGHPAENNYCSQCGQPTHLHNDTFLGLVTHFVAHYFHYDSKFWKTLKTLWAKPGALTLAYHNKQRMRYIDPFSLYIFVSAVFFLVFMSLVPDQGTRLKTGKLKILPVEVSARVGEAEPVLTVSEDSLKNMSWFDGVEYKGAIGIVRYTHDNNFRMRIDDAVIRSAPKIIFFMIPVVAGLLSLLFIRRRDVRFVDHGIFSLHFHTFCFSVMTIAVLLKPLVLYGSFFTLAGFVVASVYFLVALKRTYSVGIIRAVCYSFVVSVVYISVVAMALMATLLVTLYNQVT